MCDLVTSGKGSSMNGSLLGSGEGNVSKRSAFAIGMAEVRNRIKKDQTTYTSYHVLCFSNPSLKVQRPPPRILASPISRYDSAKPARVFSQSRPRIWGISTC